jgi:hypothetical protein
MPDEHRPGFEWDDVSSILLALMRLDSRLDEIEAKLNEILGEDDGEEEEADS